MTFARCLHALVVQSSLTFHDVVLRGHDDCVEDGSAKWPRVLFCPHALLDDGAHELRGVLAEGGGLLF